MNIILNDTQREKYKEAISDLFLLCPETMTRKIARANVQQAFVFDTIKLIGNKDCHILSVGSFEDTAAEALSKLGYKITGIDPAINCSLESFFKTAGRKYDIIFSTSVIEHVEKDEQFLDQICKLLEIGGYGILTCDFKDGYKNGDNKPGEDCRLYTKYDLLVRLNEILKKNNCKMIGDINYDSPPDFTYGVCTYSFATYMFQKQKQ